MLTKVDKPDTPSLFQGIHQSNYWSNITLRDLFAIAVVTADGEGIEDEIRFAEYAYDIAEAMLVERTKRDDAD